MITHEPKILSGTLIKQLCERRSGRTSEICKQIFDFLVYNQAGDQNKSMIVVLHNHTMIETYFNTMKELFKQNRVQEIEFNYVLRTISGVMSNNKVRFVSIVDDPNCLRGLQYKEVYFDTPELDIFKNEFIYNIVIGMSMGDNK